MTSDWFEDNDYRRHQAIDDDDEEIEDENGDDEEIETEFT